MPKLFRETVGAEKRGFVRWNLPLYEKILRERMSTVASTPPDNCSFVANVTTLFYSFIGAALKEEMRKGIYRICQSHLLRRTFLSSHR